MLTITFDSERRHYVLKSEVTLAVERSTLFDFFSDAFQLEQITPPFLKFKVMTSAPIAIRTGTLIDYQLKLHGLPIRWRTEICGWDPPQSFTDRQLRGPYRLWEHHHDFTPVDGGTLVADEVHYQVYGGGLVHRLFVRRDLLRIFRYRRDQLIQKFGAVDATENDSALTCV